MYCICDAERLDVLDRRQFVMVIVAVQPQNAFSNNEAVEFCGETCQTLLFFLNSKAGAAEPSTKVNSASYYYTIWTNH